MASTLGTRLKTTVFGQSHSSAIGCVVEGFPAGMAVDFDALSAFMARRAPGRTPWSTPRSEADAPEFVSGLNPDGVTCGAPLCALIHNTNTRSGDYAGLDRVPRPGHADAVASLKWGDAADFAGGGHFSGRLTAPLCIAGALCLQWLCQTHGITIAAHALEIAGVEDESFHALGGPGQAETLAAQIEGLRERAQERAIPTIDPTQGEAMAEAVEAARRDMDSVGGVIECVACGVPAALGEPMFDGLENLLARALFGIPAVKGVQFGRGFGVARLRGSEDNDPYEAVVDGRAVPAKNDAGGILGGITTGAPVVFSLAVKPTPSIGRAQRSVDLKEGVARELKIKGRHDPCIVPRAVPVVEAVCALVITDALLAFSDTRDPR